MDRVRLGRALGFGARQAVKTLVSAVDAATAESPAGKPAAQATRPPAQPVRPMPSPQAAKPAQPVQRPRAGIVARAAETTAQVREVRQGVQRGGRQFGKAVWNPFKRLSGVLWLEVTGVFFGLLALFAAEGVWKARDELRGASDHQHLAMAVVMFAVFGYFCVSSFVRAHRRSKRS